MAWQVREEGLFGEVAFDLKDPPHEDPEGKCSKLGEQQVQEPCKENERVCLLEAPKNGWPRGCAGGG